MRALVFVFLLLASCVPAEGPPGPAGPQGPRGPQGAPASYHEPEIYMVSETKYDSSINADVRTTCRGADAVISGGCFYQGVTSEYSTPDGVPPDPPHGWACGGTVTDSANAVTTTAVCLASQ